MSKREHLYGFIIIFGAVLSIYLWTVAPTLSFWDCGEYIACGYSLGVPHPPGTPLMVLLIRIFTLIPFGKEIGFRANMLSVISGALSAAFIWLIIVKVIERIKKIDTRMEKILAWLGGTVGAFVAAFSYTRWWNAVETEVYAISTTVLILGVWLTLKWEENIKTPEHKKYLMLIAYLTALSSGIHLAPLLGVPGILLFIFFRNRKEIRDPSVLRFIALLIPFFALCATVPLFLVFILGAFAIAFILWPSKEFARDSSFFVLTTFLIIIGFTTYGYLIIRARQNPRVNEVAPTNVEKLWESFTRKQYGPSGLAIIFKRTTASKESGYNFFQALWAQYKFFADYLIWQWTPYPREERWEKRTLSEFIKVGSVGINTVFIVITIFGLFWHYQKEKETFYLMGVIFFVLTVLFVFYMNFKFSPSDPNPIHQPREVRERHYFFDPTFLLFGFYFGIGIWGLASIIKHRWQFISPVLGVFALIPIWGNFWSHVNRHNLWVPDDYGYNMLSTCDDGATLFTNGDNDTFPLWWAQEVKKIKPSVNVANLSLLNTDWHIKQLREQGVPISFTDYEAENLMPFPVIKDGQPDRTKMLLVKDLAVRDIIAVSGGYRFKKKIFMPIKRKLLPTKYKKLFPKEMELIPPSYYMRRIPEQYWVRLPEEYFLPHQEFADLILKDGYNPIKPVYFAVTVSEGNLEGIKPYLRMEGLAYRVVGPEGPRFDIERSDSLLNKVYRYRSIFDPKVYIDENTKRLLTNYAAAYFALGMAYKGTGEIRKAIEALEFGRLFKTEETLPFTYQLASLYELVGEHEKAEKYLKQFSLGSNRDAGWYTLGKLYSSRGEIDKAKDSFRKAIESNPEDPSLGYAGLAEVAYAYQDTDELKTIFAKCVSEPRLAGKMLSIFRAEQQNELAQVLLQEWITYHPYDTVARSLFKEFK